MTRVYGLGFASISSTEKPLEEGARRRRRIECLAEAQLTETHTIRTKRLPRIVIPSEAEESFSFAVKRFLCAKPETGSLSSSILCGATYYDTPHQNPEPANLNPEPIHSKTLSRSG